MCQINEKCIKLFHSLESVFSCGSNSINTAVCLFIFCFFLLFSVLCSQFFNFVNESSTEANWELYKELAKKTLCVANPRMNRRQRTNQKLLLCMQLTLLEIHFECLNLILLYTVTYTKWGKNMFYTGIFRTNY